MEIEFDVDPELEKEVFEDSIIYQKILDTIFEYSKDKDAEKLYYDLMRDIKKILIN